MTTSMPAIGDREVSDAYIYLLSRLLVLRQQQLDFQEGFTWNTIVHRKPGEVEWPNPNLDVAYSEAWVAVDETSGLIVAICLAGSDVPVPAGAQRVDVPVKYMRVLLRVELGADWDEAVALQQPFTFRATGRPALPEIPRTVMFDIKALPGVEAFDSAELALDSEKDINPGMEPLRAATRGIARAIQDPATRARVDQAIRTTAFADIRKAMPTLGDGTLRDGWSLASTMGAYGNNWLLRTLVNDGGIWANTMDEVIYYKGFVDPSGAPLSGDNAYTMTFTKAQLPTPKRLHYSLTFRFYRPQGAVADRTYFPPPLVKR